MKVLDLVGKKFNRLTVIKRVENLSNGRDKSKKMSAWLCICDCGNTKIIRGRDLKTGNTRSCGCLSNEIKRGLNYKHGLSHTSIYRLWRGIKVRCSTKNKGKNKKFYEGIKMCDEWLNFETFYSWAKDKYKHGLDIDRIDTFKGYSPNNCRFTTRKINTQNTKRSRWWYIEDKKFPSAYDAAKYFGVVQSTIVSWCNGKKCGKYEYPKRQGCYSIKKYNLEEI